MIACIGPEFIQGPTEWNDSHVEIIRQADGFIVKDVRAGMKIHAGHVEVAEDMQRG